MHNVLIRTCFFSLSLCLSVGLCLGSGSETLWAIKRVEQAYDLRPQTHCACVCVCLNGEAMRLRQKSAIRYPQSMISYLGYFGLGS